MKKILSFLLLGFLLSIGNAWGTDTFKKVTSDSEIADGNKYILVCESKNVAMKVYSSGTKCDGVAITISNNKVTSVANINVLTIEAGDNGWYFKQEDGNYLYSSAAKNLKAENTSNKTLCTITDDYQIMMGSNGRLQYNAGSPRFCPYTSNQTVAVLYVKEEVSELTSIAISGTYPTTFHTGDAFSHEGMTVTATYEDASTQDVTTSATFSGYDMDNAGVQTVTVSYTENEVTKTATYDITVNAPATLSSITLSGSYPTEFTEGDAFSSEGIVVKANWSDATTSIVTGDATFSGYDMSTTGEQTVTVSYGDKTATYTITVNAYVQPTVVTVNMNYTWLGSNNGSNLSSNQLPVVKEEENITITITDGTSTRPRGDADYIRVYKGSTIKFEAPTGYILTEIVFTTGGNDTWNAPTFDAGTLSEKTWTGEDEEVTFTLSGSCFIASAAITLEANTPKVLSSIALSGEYPTTFHTGDAFSHEGMTVTANYEGGKTADVTANATFTGYDMANTGEQTVTVSYTENEVVKTTTYTITVNAPATLTSITLSGTNPVEFEQGDEFSSEGIVVTANWSDETTTDVTSDATFSGYDMSTVGEQTVTVSYNDKTATYTITVAEKSGTLAKPYTVAQAIAATPASGTSADVYIHGIVSAFFGSNTDITTDQYHRYYISDDGTTATQLLVFKGKGLNEVAFSDADDLLIGDEVTILGGLTTYSSTKEVAADNYIVSLDRPVVTTPSIEVSTESVEATAEGADGTITVTYNNITTIAAEVYFCDANGDAATYDWVDAEINNDNNVDYVIYENTGEARTAYLKVYALDDEANDVYSELITISQAAYVAPAAPSAYFTKVTATADIIDGEYLIVYEDGAVAFDGSQTTLDDSNNTIDVEIEEGKIVADDATLASIFTIDVTNGTLQSKSGKYIGVNSNSNGLKTEDTPSSYTNSFSIDEGNDAIISAVFEESTMTLRYNSASNQARFRYYKSGQQDIQLYKSPFSIKLNSYGYATYCSPKPLDFTNASGYTAWYVSDVTDNVITFSQITGTIEGGQGILLKGLQNAGITLTPAESSANVLTDNMLVGCVVAKTVNDAPNYYVLSGNQFMNLDDWNGTIPAGKAYLDLAGLSLAPGALRIAFAENNTTDVKAIEASETAVKFFENGQLFILRDGVVYDAMGKMVR